MVSVDEIIEQFPNDVIKMAKILNKQDLKVTLCNQLIEFVNKNIDAIYEKIQKK